MTLNKNILNLFNKDLAFKRIRKDVLTDFIYAPHINIIYAKAKDKLYENLLNKLNKGTFSPKLPFTIEVPKISGLSRPGSILGPFERLIYQLLIDYIAPEAEKELDRRRVFSHVLLKQDKDGLMFEPDYKSYSKFRNELIKFSTKRKYSYVLRADVASYFERLYQHVLINLLQSSVQNEQIVNFLEKLLSAFTLKDSHGIIQGVFPSDFLGNFYLCSIDAEHALNNLPFVRYVDDIYIFFKSEREARYHKVRLASWLRKDGLNLNEAKTKVFKAEDLIQEETEIDKMFEEAKSEIENDDIGLYQSTDPWELVEEEFEEEKTDEEKELLATKSLFDAEKVSWTTRMRIDKFCLPIFTACKDIYAMDYVLKSFPLNPHMSQIYSNYLRSIINKDGSLMSKLENLLNNKEVIFDYQKMWLYATALSIDKVSQRIIKKALSDLKNANLSEALRAVCAILVGKYCNASQRRVLRNHYTQEQSEYVKSAVLFASQYFPQTERDTCFRAWAGHSDINALIVSAIKNS